MCTAISAFYSRHIFGRTLDVAHDYGESAVLTPRFYSFKFLHQKELFEHSAIIGTAVVENGAPLYFDAMNESGLCIAALNFPKSARYYIPTAGKINLASFEFIPFVLSNCESTDEAKRLIEDVNITPDSVSPDTPATTLHWLLADAERALVAEQTEQGMRVYENPLRTLTNEPPFHTQEADFYSASSVPGDFSSSSRFRRAAFMCENVKMPKMSDPDADVSRFFHIADTVVTPFGLEPIYTLYTACFDPMRGSMCARTYDERKIFAKFSDADLDASGILKSPPYYKAEWVNGGF